MHKQACPKIFAPLFTILSALVLANPASADTINVMWDPNPEPDLAGYIVYVGTQPGTYTQTIDVGLTTGFSYTTAVAGQRYCFAVTAYVDGPIESPRSTEVCGFSNAPPALVNPGAQDSTLGQADSLQLAGSDPDGDPLTYSATGLPPGLTLMASTGYIAGTPTTAGTYSVTARASDGVLTASRTFTWTVNAADTTAPVVNITSPTSASTYSTSATALTLSGNASDANGVTQVTWMNSRGGSGTATGTTSWSVSSMTLLPGDNVLTVTARDAADNRSSKALTVTVNSAPALAAVANQSSTVGLATTLQLAGSDPDGDPLSYSATGLPSGLSVAAATGLISGTPTASGVFNVVATVSAGALTASRTFTWTITQDTTDPVVAITGPTSSTTFTTTTGTITLSGTASDNVGVTQVSWSNSRGGSGTVSGTTTTWSAGVTLQSGSNDLTVTARDGAGNTSTDLLTVTYNTADTTAPVITIKKPTTNATITRNAATLDLSGTASDNVGVTRVTWSNDRGGSGTASGTTNWSVTGILLQPGNNVLTVTAFDAAGNTRTDVLTVTFTDPLRVASLTADRPAPQPVGTTVTFTAVAAGGAGPYQYLWRVHDGTRWVAQTGWGSNNRFVWTPTTATSAYKVRAVVKGATGSTTATATMDFPIVP
jgi:hypothetical protein